MHSGLISRRNRCMTYLRAIILFAPLPLGAVQSPQWNIEKARLSELTEVTLTSSPNRADLYSGVRPSEMHVILQIEARYTPAPASAPLVMKQVGASRPLDVATGVSPSDIRLSGLSSRDGISSMWSTEPIAWAAKGKNGKCHYMLPHRGTSGGRDTSAYVVWFLTQPGADTRLIVNGKRAIICLAFDVPAGRRSKLSLKFGGTEVPIR